MMNFPQLMYGRMEKLLESLPFKQEYYSFLKKPYHLEQLCDEFYKVLKRNLTLEEVSSLYAASIAIALVGRTTESNYKYLMLMISCFSYSDTLKPTMIDYFTRNLLDKFKFINKDDETNMNYMMHILTIIPHIIAASETGKLIALGLLRAFIAELTGTEIKMHIYRNLTDIWHMLKTLNLDTVVEDWPVPKIYLLTESYALLMNTAAFGPNIALKEAGYRGFELPSNFDETATWFKDFQEKFVTKYKSNKKALMISYLIGDNILGVMLEEQNDASVQE